MPKTKIWTALICPETKSPLALFHRKVLKGFLKLSKTAPTPSIHFLLGELPMEGKIHRDMFALFFGVWSNPFFTKGLILYQAL